MYTKTKEVIILNEPKYIIDMGLNVEIINLEFGEEKVKPPIGLSELLGPAWVIPTNEMLEKMEQDEKEIEQNYERRVYKNEKGCWATEYRRVGENKLK